MRLSGAVDIVEQGYALNPPWAEWLETLVTEIARPLDLGGGVVAVLVDLTGRQPQLIHPVTRGTSPQLLAELAAFNANAPPGVASRFRNCLVSFTSSRTFFDGGEARYVHGFMESFGFSEFAGLYAQDGEGQALFVVAPTRRTLRIHGHLRKAWERVGLHLGAAIRLRRRVRAGASPVGHFLPSGRALHLEDEATGTETRRVLVEAVRASERARGPLRRSPAEALEVWRGLVDGRYSLVESIEADGRRLLVVHRNAPGLGDPRALTPRERTLLSYLSHSATNAQVAYAMGVDASSIASATRRLLRKLKLPHREALLGLDEPDRLERLPVALRGQVLDVLRVTPPGADATRMARLSASERRIAEGVLEGRSDAEIARRLGRSPRTVSNLLRKAYARAGVRDRVSLVAWLTGSQ